MSIHTLIPLESKDEWSEAVKDIRHSFSHTWDNCYAMHLTTSHKTFLYRYENGNAKIICPFAERQFEGSTDIVTPYGFSGFTGNTDCPDFPHHWKEFAKQSGYVSGYISINPAFENTSYYYEKDAVSRTSIYYIDLERSLTEIFESLDSNRRRQIKDYRRHESSFVYDRTRLTDFFKQNYYDFLDKYKMSSANNFSIATLEYICSLENVMMVGTEKNDEINSVYIFAHTPHEGLCMFNVAHPEGRENTPLLLWCGLKYFRSKKIPIMNLGGGSNDDDSIAHSKKRYGAYGLPFKSLTQIYDESAYKVLCSKAGADMNGQYFPAYRNPKSLNKHN
ncbi:MAG: hypothetical protein WBC65_15285 [Ignavibacteria bacterium]